MERPAALIHHQRLDGGHPGLGKMSLGGRLQGQRKAQHVAGGHGGRSGRILLDLRLDDAGSHPGKLGLALGSLQGTVLVEDNSQRVKPACRGGVDICLALPQRRVLHIRSGISRQPYHCAAAPVVEVHPQVHVKPCPCRKINCPHPAGVQGNAPGLAWLRPPKADRLPVGEIIRRNPPGRHINAGLAKRQHGGSSRHLHIIHPHAACLDGGCRTCQVMPQRRSCRNREPLHGGRTGAGTQLQHHVLAVGVHHQLIAAGVSGEPLAGV